MPTGKIPAAPFRPEIEYRYESGVDFWGHSGIKVIAGGLHEVITFRERSGLSERRVQERVRRTAKKLARKGRKIQKTRSALQSVLEEREEK